MILGGIFQLDLLECVPHPSSSDPHIRITTFTNLPTHKTSHAKAEVIMKTHPSSFNARKTSIELVTSKPLSEHLKVALELSIKSTGNSERNTLEIVLAGLGFIAIGGNFESAKIRVWSPEGRGVGVRRPIVQRINGGFRLNIIKRRKPRILVANQSRLRKESDISSVLEAAS